MNHWQDLYNQHTDRYERLVLHEDVAGNLLSALAKICELPQARVVEFGAGTGHISGQLAPLVQQVWAFDLTPAVVRMAHRKRMQAKVMNWQTAVSDSRAMPLPNSCADVAIEGWSFVQLVILLTAAKHPPFSPNVSPAPPANAPPADAASTPLPGLPFRCAASRAATTGTGCRVHPPQWTRCGKN